MSRVFCFVFSVFSLTFQDLGTQESKNTHNFDIKNALRMILTVTVNLGTSVLKVAMRKHFVSNSRRCLWLIKPTQNTSRWQLDLIFFCLLG